MKKISILLLLCISYTCFSQKKASAPVITRYIVLTGTIDKYPITVHLYRINDDFSGHYYYNNTEVPIDIIGKIDKDRSLELTHTSSDDKSNEVFHGTFKDTVYSGTWSYKGKLNTFRVTQKKDDSPLRFDYIWTSGEKKLVPKPEYDPDELSYDAATVWPAAGFPQPAADSLKRIIRQSFGEKSSTEEIGKILIRRKNEVLSPVIKDSDEIITYSSSNVLQVVYSNPKLLSLSFSNYSFSGGAHGNYGTSYTCFDLLNNKEIKLVDVLDTLAGNAAISKLLERKFRAVYTEMISTEDKLNEILFVEKIPVNDNFMLTGKGITFNYVPYEIAAYAFGEISLYIPYKEIMQYLKPEFKKLVGITQ